MSDSSWSSSTPTSEIIEEDQVSHQTLKAVNWDRLLTIARDIHKAKSATWSAQQLTGSFNIVRFILLGYEDGGQDTEIVARVPYHPLDRSEDWVKAQTNCIASEVASMEYVAFHTNIPVPRVIAYNAEKDGGGVGSPYILMTKMEGKPLFKFWEGMGDGKRKYILSQVVDILLQLCALRFDGIGVLMRKEGSLGHFKSKDEWYIAPKTTIYSPKDPNTDAFMHQVFKSGVDYWITYANVRLERCDKEHFGQVNKSFEYAMLWFLRSLIPTVIDPSLDAEGFPIFHGDFHSQNILVADLDTPSPRITAVIDWEFTATDCTSSVAQFPLFIVDHPFWNKDHPLRERNLRDQKTFLRLLHEKESSKNGEGKPLLSRVYEKCYGMYLYGMYLFEQCISNPLMFNTLYHDIFGYVFGEENEEEPFSVEYCMALHRGLLRRKTEKFEKEALARKEAVAILGEELITMKLSREEFKTIVEENLEKLESVEQ